MNDMTTDALELYCRNLSRAKNDLTEYDRALLMDVSARLYELQSRAPLPDNKALTCEGCECEEGQSPSRCRRCMRYGDRTDNYRRPPEKGE